MGLQCLSLRKSKSFNGVKQTSQCIQACTLSMKQTVQRTVGTIDMPYSWVGLNVTMSFCILAVLWPGVCSLTKLDGKPDVPLSSIPGSLSASSAAAKSAFSLEVCKNIHWAVGHKRHQLWTTSTQMYASCWQTDVLAATISTAEGHIPIY